MSKSKIVHFLSHCCGPQECDCRPRCFQREGDEIQVTATAKDVTCKNCLKAMAADQKRKLARKSTKIGGVYSEQSIELTERRVAEDLLDSLREALAKGMAQ